MVGATGDAAAGEEGTPVSPASLTQLLLGARLQTDGVVSRHHSGGPSGPSESDRRLAEDAACTAGLRNPRRLLSSWSELVGTMRLVMASLLKARCRSQSLQDLYRAGGASPARQPPEAAAIAAVRADVAAALGVSPGAAELTHPASPWRYQLFRALASRSGDPDQAVAQWLQHGAPMGISEAIEAGGHFPLRHEEADLDLGSLANLPSEGINHASFDRGPTGTEAAGPRLVADAVDAGFGELFADRAAATAACGATVFPAPMGDLAKEKEDGSIKHRLIQDLKANQVNRTVRLPERQVLPRPVDRAVDLAEMVSRRQPGQSLMVGVIDFENAFMSIPLSDTERRFNCAEIPEGISRTRSPLRWDEPTTGTVILWRVLGFGGRPNPLVFARVAGFAIRSAQALFPQGQAATEHGDLDVEASAQLYVDDTIIAILGALHCAVLAFDCILLWWLALGAPIAWTKVTLLPVGVGSAHRWVGVDFTVRQSGQAVMTLPDAFVDDVLRRLEPFARSFGTIPIVDVEALLGRLARIVYVVPLARPYATAIWTAAAEARRIASSGPLEAPTGRFPARRFAPAAAWLARLLQDPIGFGSWPGPTRTGGFPSLAWSSPVDASPRRCVRRIPLGRRRSPAAGWRRHGVSCHAVAA